MSEKPWVCDKCQSHNSGTNTSCAACGDPRTEADEEAGPDVEEARRDIDVAIDELADLCVVWSRYNERDGTALERDARFEQGDDKPYRPRFVRAAIIAAVKEIAAIAEHVEQIVAIDTATGILQGLERTLEAARSRATPPAAAAAPADSPPPAQKEAAPGQEPGSPPDAHP